MWPMRFYLGMVPWIFHGPSFETLRRYRGQIELRVKDFALGFSLVSGQLEPIPLLSLLLQAGILMTPSTVTWKPFDPWQRGAWYPVWRYGNSFATVDSLLRVEDHVANIDSRLRAVLSEELAIGYCGHVLRDKFDVLHIADAAPLIGKTLTWSTSNSRRRPDYLGRTADGTIVIAEAKGTLGDMRSLSSRMAQGKRQVNSVTPLGAVSAQRLVLGLALATTSEPRKSVGAIYDPPEGDDVQTFRLDSEVLIRHSYAKTLSAMGLYVHADHLVRRESWNEIPEEPVGNFEIQGVTYVAPSPLLEIQRLRDEETVWPLIGIRSDLYRILASGRNVANRVDDALLDASSPDLEQGDRAIRFNNGVVVSV